MHAAPRQGFSLLETIIALTLFAGVLLSMLGTGQLILAHLYESDQRFRASAYKQSLIDSLRGTACARLSSGRATRAPFTAAWSVTDLLDVARVDLTLSIPQRQAPPAAQHSVALLPCPEP